MKYKTALMLMVAMALSRGEVYCQEPPAPAPAPVPPAISELSPAPALLPERPAPLPTNAGPSKAEPAPAPESEPVTEELVDINILPDATLPNAVQMLARFAKINYLFDPSLLAEKAADGTSAASAVVGFEARWKGVTAAQALDALLDNYGWQMISNSSTGIMRITRKDLKAPEPVSTKVYQLKYCSPTNLFGQLTNAFKAGFPQAVIAPDLRTGQIVIVAPEKIIPLIEATLESLDKPSRQILIETRLIQTTRNPESFKGVDWTDTLQSQKMLFGNGNVQSAANTYTTTTTTGTGSVGGSTKSGATTTTTTVPGSVVTTGLTAVTGASGMPGLTANTRSGFSPSTAFLNADGVSVALSFLNSDNQSEIVAMPRTVVLDGVSTELAVIRNIPVFEQNQTPGQGGSSSMTTVKAVYDEKVGDNIINEIGTKLTVTPRIVGDTNVNLELKPELSEEESIAAEFKLNGADNTSPIFKRSRMTTRAIIPSGCTLVLGGLKQDTTTKDITKVPILGDIPGLGFFFRHEHNSGLKNNLIFFVTPTIIKDSDFQPTKTEYLKQRFVDKPEVKESAWDSAEPYDWTKPKGEVEPVYAPTAQ